MNKDNKFIKEKLKILEDGINDTEITPPDMTEQKRQLSELFVRRFSEKQNETYFKKNNNKRIFLKLTAGAACLVLLSVFITIIAVNLNKGDNYYNDNELIGIQYSHKDFSEQVDLLLPDSAVEYTEFWIYKHENSNIIVFVKIISDTGFGDNVEIVITLLDSYIFAKRDIYENLSQTGETKLFSYTYDKFEQNNLAYAKFIYNGHRYYLKFNSSAPENIVSLLESFS